MIRVAGRYPKPDSERRNPNPPAFGWVILAPRPRVKAPALPKGRAWCPETVAWWRELWGRPQAAMWDETGITLHPAARLHDLIATKGTTASLEAELRHHYDRHGLSPKGLLQLRWRVGDLGDLEQPPAPSRRNSQTAARRRRLLRAVDS